MRALDRLAPSLAALACALVFFTGCGSQQSSMSRNMMLQPATTQATAMPPSAETQEVLFVGFNDGCSQDDNQTCAGSVFSYSINSDGSVKAQQKSISTVNPLLMVADKQHGTVAVENFATSINGWYELTAYRAGSDGSLSSLGMIVLTTLSALRFDATGRWLFAAPGPTNLFTQVDGSEISAFDLTNALASNAGGSFGFAASDTAISPSNTIFAAAKGDASAFTLDDEGELEHHASSSITGDSQASIEPQLAIEPLGRWLYVQSQAGQLDAYLIAQNGGLSHSSTSNSGWLFGSEFSPDGKYLISGSQLYKINQQDGSLQSPKNFTTNSVISLDLDPAGMILYTLEAANSGDVPKLYAYQFDASVGTLTPISTGPWTIGSSTHIPNAVVTVLPQ